MVTVTSEVRSDLCRHVLETLGSSKHASQSFLPLDTQTIMELSMKVTVSAVVDSVLRARHNLIVILSLFEGYGMDLLGVRDCLLENFVFLVYLDLVDMMEALLKWSGAHHLALNLKQDKYRVMPHHPPGHTSNRTFLGKLEKSLIRLTHSSREFCWSWNMVKKGCAPLRFWNVVNSVNKHKKTLTEDKETDYETLEVIKRVVSGLFTKKNGKSKIANSFNIPPPSLSAGFQNSQPKGGNRTFIYKQLDDLVKEYQVEYGEEWGNGLMPMTASVAINLTRARTTNDFWEEIPEYPEYEYIDLDKDLSGEKQTCENISDVSLFSLLENKVKEISTVRTGVVALSEPFKTRIITKSDSLVNYYGLPMQKMVHKLMREMKVFRLIGQPLTLDIIQETYGNIPKGHLFVSGDYSSATDNIHTDASVAALRSILDTLDLTNDCKSSLLKTLQGQVLDYSSTLINYIYGDPTVPSELLTGVEKKDGKSLGVILKNIEEWNKKEGNRFITIDRWVQQTNGQLMGSILSFPILCLLNYTMFVMSYEQYCLVHPNGIDNHGNMTIGRFNDIFGLMINGDDIAFHATQELIDIWTKTFGRIGLTESIGKNFVHPSVITINSKLYTGERIKNERMVWTEVKYANMGLTFAASTYVVETSPRRILELIKSGPRIQEDLMNSLSDQVKEYFSGLYLHNLTGVLKEHVPKEINWFLPIYGGGLGLRTSDDFSITSDQNRVMVQAFTRTTPEQVRHFKVMTSKVPLPSKTREQMDLAASICDGLNPTVVFRSKNYVPLHEEEDELVSELMKREVFSNVLTTSALKELHSYTGADLLSFLKSLRRRFTSLIQYSSLKPMTRKHIEHIISDGTKPFIQLGDYMSLIIHEDHGHYH